MKYFFIICCLLSFNANAQWQHPVAFCTQSEYHSIQTALKNKGLLYEAFCELRNSVDAQLNNEIDVPIPKDPAGGYTHDQHKRNYMLMFNAGQLYQITGNENYALLVKKILLKYALLNPTLPNHPEATGNKAGKLFWQSLNDANWLVYTGLAFDCIHDYLTDNERKEIANGAFRPIVEYFTKGISTWFDLIHNHAVWAAAGVGIVGMATDNNEYVDMALYGSKKDHKAGFIAQLDGLFSPDGFYHEGPYYTRYAILPFYLFAHAVDQIHPELKIFRHRDNILEKALDVALQQTNLDGSFFSYNDALKDKTYTSGELVYAVNIASQHYGMNVDWQAVIQAQNKVVLTTGGLLVSDYMKKHNNTKASFPYKSAEYKDGADGNQGGVSVLRNRTANDLTTLVYKYTSHGLSHGHFDKLNIQLFDKGNEVLQDYGAVRYINIEQKWGGRYLKETNTYAQQSIAHNTIVIDETSHFNGSEKISEQHHPIKLFSEINNENLKVTSCLDEDAYPGVKLFRTEYLLTIPSKNKMILFDVFNIQSDSIHQIDLPFHYDGVFMNSSYRYSSFNSSMKTFGIKNGYQHLWVEAKAEKVNPFSQFTFLNHQNFYTISTLTNDTSSVFFVRTGANDPDFNLRRDPAFVIRVHAKNQTFFSALERHGDFSPVTEIAHQSISEIQSIESLESNDALLVFKVKLNDRNMILFQCRKDFDVNSKHEYLFNGKVIQWTGPYHLETN